MKIAIKCRAGMNLAYNQLNDFQGDLKELSDENYQRLKKEIATTGFAFAPHAWLNPSDRQWYLIDGHQRVKTIKRMVEEDKFECPKLPVVPVEAGSYQEAKRRVLQGVSQYGHVTEEGLKHFIIDAKFEIGDIEMSFDFPHVEMPQFISEHFRQSSSEADQKEDELPPAPEKSKVRIGELFLLDGHRLMCGDSTDITSVEKLMNGENADITFTSPPYNAGKNIRGNFYINDLDDKTEDEYVSFLNVVTRNCLEKCQFVFVNLQILEGNKKALVKYQYENVDNLKDVLIWDKKQYPPHINKGTFGCKWEYVFAFGQDGKSRAFPCSWQGKFPNVIETENNSGNEFSGTHKAGFPVAFPLWIIEKMDFAKSVIDPFGGTGSTLIACEKTNRKCFMMEIDPHYCHVILDRWAAFSGKEPCRDDGKTWSQIKAESF